MLDSQVLERAKRVTVDMIQKRFNAGVEVQNLASGFRS